MYMTCQSTLFGIESLKTKTENWGTMRNLWELHSMRKYNVNIKSIKTVLNYCLKCGQAVTAISRKKHICTYKKK